MNKPSTWGITFIKTDGDEWQNLKRWGDTFADPQPHPMFTAMIEMQFGACFRCGRKPAVGDMWRTEYSGGEMQRTGHTKCFEEEAMTNGDWNAAGYTDEEKQKLLHFYALTEKQRERFIIDASDWGDSKPGDLLDESGAPPSQGEER